jgi:signal peptidase I
VAARPASAGPRADESGARSLLVRLAGYSRIVTISVLGWVIAVVLVAVLPVFAGRSSYIVLGSSMEPAVHVGSVVVVERVSAEALRADDVITYIDRANEMVTHRVVEVVEDKAGPGLRTRGDANASDDPELVRPVNVQGRVVYSVPLAGYLLNLTNQPPTRLVLMAPALVVVLSHLVGGRWPTLPSLARSWRLATRQRRTSQMA